MELFAARMAGELWYLIGAYMKYAEADVALLHAGESLVEVRLPQHQTIPNRTVLMTTKCPTR